MSVTTQRPIADLPSHELGFKPPHDVFSELNTIATRFLVKLELAVQHNDGDAFSDLFIHNGFWRDVLAFTNDYRTIRAGNIAAAAKARFPIVKARNFNLATTKPPSLDQPYDDVTFISLHFTFQTAVGPSYGVANLVYDTDAWRAFTVFTLLEGVHGHPQRIGAARTRGSHNDRVSYDDRRLEEAEFKDRSPSVLIIGGGHNGLATAAQLQALGIETLIVDTYKRIGDNWRLRYRSLSLHDPVHVNHLPFVPFPPSWPVYTPAGKLANFLESYAEVLELNVWCQSSVDPSRTQFNTATNKWDVTILRTLANGERQERTFSVNHVVLATGLGGGKPKMPAPFPGQAGWDGVAIHSSKHSSGADWKGKRALVVGACTSGHDLAMDFAQNGVDVTMLQRSPTYVMTVEKGQKMMMGGLYCEGGPPTDLADRIGESNPKEVVLLYQKRNIPKLAEQDRDLLEGLTKAGFSWWLGPKNSGFLSLAWDKAGGYYFSTGASELIVDGHIKVKQGEIASFEPGHQVKFKDGSAAQFDVVVFATGYTGFPDTVRATLGDKYADSFNPVWGQDEEGEIRGVCRESGIPNMFFIVGALAPCRVSSKVLALQILQQQLGIFGERYTWEKQKTDGDLSDYRKLHLLNGHSTPVRDGE